MELDRRSALKALAVWPATPIASPGTERKHPTWVGERLVDRIVLGRLRARFPWFFVADPIERSGEENKRRLLVVWRYELGEFRRVKKQLLKMGL